jgi:Zn-dependent protease
MLTALGGPAASLLLGIACFAALVASVAAGGGPGRVRDLLRIAVELNVFGAAFNLLPIPPLDGSSILEFFLPRSALRAWNGLREYSWVLFGALMFTGVLSKALAPVMRLTRDLVDFGVEAGGRLGHG